MTSKKAKLTGGTEIDVEAILPCNAHEYFVERDSAAFQSLLAKSLKLGTLCFRDAWEEGGSTFVRVVTKPDVASWVPASVRNAVANASEVEFFDIIEYSPADTSGPSYTLHIYTESPFLGEKLEVQTTLTMTPLTPTTTLQRLQGRVKVRIFGVGGFIEKAIRDNMVKTYAQLPDIVGRWVAYREQVLKSGDTGVLLDGRPPVGSDLTYVRSLMQGNLHKPVPLAAPTAEGTVLEEVDGRKRKSVELLMDTSAKRRETETPETVPEDAEKPEKHIQRLPSVPEAISNPEIVKTTEQAEPGSESPTLMAAPRPVVMAERPALHKAGVPPLHPGAAEGATTTAGALAHLPPAPRHARRRTAESLILDAMRLTPPNLEGFGEALTPLTQPSRPRHWRGLSDGSAGGGTEGGASSGELERRRPGSKGQDAAWRRFNRDYAAWDKYWSSEVGVKAATAAQGALRVLQMIWHGIIDVIRVLFLVILLGLLRAGLVKVLPTRPRAQQRHRRTHSCPPEALLQSATFHQRPVQTRTYSEPTRRARQPTSILSLEGQRNINRTEGGYNNVINNNLGGSDEVRPSRISNGLGNGSALGRSISLDSAKKAA